MTRLVLRGLAVALLLLGVVSGASLDRDRDAGQPSLPRAEQAGATHTEAQLLQRMADAQDQVDRARRTQYGATDGAGADDQRVARAEEPDTRTRQRPQERQATGGEPAGPVPGSCGEYGGNRATGCALLLDHGFSMEQMSCLESLWTKESRWRTQARNPSSGAYGIPQALPGSKMASAGADWRTNPVTQIRWGLGYIGDRYGTPCAAWSHSQRTGWY